MELSNRADVVNSLADILVRLYSKHLECSECIYLSYDNLLKTADVGHYPITRTYGISGCCFDVDEDGDYQIYIYDCMEWSGGIYYFYNNEYELAEFSGVDYEKFTNECKVYSYYDSIEALADDLDINADDLIKATETSLKITSPEFSDVVRFVTANDDYMKMLAEFVSNTDISYQTAFEYVESRDDYMEKLEDYYNWYLENYTREEMRETAEEIISYFEENFEDNE